jgi:carboxyl-terminal processing protease
LKDKSRRLHLKSGGPWSCEWGPLHGSQAYVPEDEAKDKALHAAFDLLRGVKTAEALKVEASKAAPSSADPAAAPPSPKPESR